MIHVTDLSHSLTPEKQRFKLELKSFPVKEYVPGYKVAEGQWYIMQEVLLCTHVGTHVEAPYHAIQDGMQAGEVNMRSLIGPAALVDVTGKGSNEAITKKELVQRGTHIQPDDIVLIKTGLSRYYGTKDYQRPYIETDAIEWLVVQKIKCLGIDCSGIENKQINSKQINHRILFKNNILLIEDMNNLDKLRDKRVFFMAFTLPIMGLDASPMRPIAIEPLEACKNLDDIFLRSELSS
jgi:arylformamidase